MPLRSANEHWSLTLSDDTGLATLTLGSEFTT